jgi:hypothetical protein
MDITEKICGRCKVKKRIGLFGLNKTTKDGKQLYCKDCFKMSRKKYSITPRAKSKDSKRVTLWKNNHKDKIKKYNAEYYLKNKELLKSKKNTECVMIIETPNNNINRKRRNKRICVMDIVIDPKPIIGGKI